MKSGSIYKKIRKQVLLGSFIAATALCLATVLSIIVMRGNIIDTSERLGAAAAYDSKEALELQMQESLLQLAHNKAAISDEKLAAVSRLVTQTAENASAIVSNPDAYGEFHMGFPDAANEGITVSQLRLAEDVERESVEDEIGLLGHISPLLISLHDSLEHVRTVYIGTERGVSISADGDSNLKTNVFDPRPRGWYVTAKNAGELIWTDVFADATGRGLAVTCAMPFYGRDGNLSGVVGAGMQLGVLNEIVLEARMGETGYAFITNERGELIISDLVTIDDDGTIQSPGLNELLPSETAERITGGQSGIERILLEGADYFIAYAPLHTRPWSLAVAMSVEEVIAPAIKSEQNIIGMTIDALAGIDQIIFIVIGVLAVALALTLAGNAVLARRMAAELAKPIIELNDGALIIGSGDLEYRLDVRTGDEIEELSDSFNTMIANIKTITADKERIGAELDVATNIQASMLPCIFPAFPDRAEFDIYASMLPAKEVGGDFYDFFLIDERTLGVVMADVSGKGVPAALFMVIAKTLIKNNAQYGKSPKEVFDTVNNMLCENNDAAMFVTAFMGYLDIPTGKVTYVNAGHNPPLIRTASGQFDWLKSDVGLPLAIMEDMDYKQGEVSLGKGDELFLYTDGVTEAVNNEEELFTDPKLLETANNYLDVPLKDFTVSIKQEIDKFAEGAEQADDITMLALRYRGAK